MKVFVGFGYNDRDAWIKETIIDMLEALEVEVITGEDVHGEVLDPAVRSRIEQSNGLIAFLTKRDNSSSTHPWVRDELVTAIALNKKVVEVREEGVDIPNGIAGNRQYISLSLTKKEKVLTELIKTIKKWEREGYKRLALLPDSLVMEIGPCLSQCRCYYKYLHDYEESAELPATLRNINQGIYVDVKNIPSNEALVMLRIEGPGILWTSSYTSLHNISINFKKQP